MTKNPALSLRAQWLGERLRIARKQAGQMLEGAAEYLQVSANTVSCFERGVLRVKPSYVQDLVDFYGISSAAERRALLQLSEDAWQKNVWDGASGTLELGFLDYFWLERRAVRIDAYDPLLVSGLLQTAAYAEALTIDTFSGPSDLAPVAETIEVRTTRQEILTKETPTELRVVFEESALARSSSPEVQTGQLMHLLRMSRRPNIQIRVIDARAGWHAGLHGPFTIMHMPDPYPDIVYIESLVGRTFLEDDQSIDAYRLAYDGVNSAARSPSESMKYIRSLLKERS